MSTTRGWIAVDLDGTLAVYDHWRGVEHIGSPIMPMVERIKKWIADGEEVRIFTARVSDPDHKEAIDIIEDWCLIHLGVRLRVTNVKDYAMRELWDDRAIQVVRNTGEQVGNHFVLGADILCPTCENRFIPASTQTHCHVCIDQGRHRGER